jgi:hypothetical protein
MPKATSIVGYDGVDVVDALRLKGLRGNWWFEPSE